MGVCGPGPGSAARWPWTVSLQSSGHNPSAVSAARDFLRGALSDLGLTETSSDLIDLPIMAANELATNPVLHARTEFTTRVLADPIRVRVEVSDANPRTPQPDPAPAHATSGRGLAIIDGSGLQWGMDPHPDGKTMWIQATR